MVDKIALSEFEQRFSALKRWPGRAEYMDVRSNARPVGRDLKTARLRSSEIFSSGEMAEWSKARPC